MFSTFVHVVAFNNISCLFSVLLRHNSQIKLYIIKVYKVGAGEDGSGVGEFISHHLPELN